MRAVAVGLQNDPRDEGAQKYYRGNINLQEIQIEPAWNQIFYKKLANWLCIDLTVPHWNNQNPGFHRLQQVNLHKKSQLFKKTIIQLGERVTGEREL